MTDSQGVLLFAIKMTERLDESAHSGKHGWQHMDEVALNDLEVNLMDNVEEYINEKDTDELINIANYCMMLYHRRTSLQE